MKILLLKRFPNTFGIYSFLNLITFKMNDFTQSRYRYINLKNRVILKRYSFLDNGIKVNNEVDNLNQIPTHGTYGALLFRSEWKIKREQILQRDFHKCFICNDNNSLQVHHRQYHFIVDENKYKLPWAYSDYLMVTLCESCHRRGHSKFKVQTINI